MEWWGNLAAVVLAVIAIATVLYHGIKWKVNTDKDVTRLPEEARVDREYFNATVTTIREDNKTVHGSLDAAVTEIRRDIKQILLYLHPRAPIVSQSLYRLTEYGETLADKLDAKLWVQQLISELQHEVKDKEKRMCKTNLPMTGVAA